MAVQRSHTTLLRLIRVQSIDAVKFFFNDRVKTLSVASYHMKGNICTFDNL